MAKSSTPESACSKECDAIVKQTETQSPSRQINNVNDHNHIHWTRPEAGWYKCYVDGSITNSTSLTQAGWIVGDSKGYYQGAAQSLGKTVNNAFESEFQAVIMAMQNCWSKGYKKITIEGNCKKVYGYS